MNAQPKSLLTALLIFCLACLSIAYGFLIYQNSRLNYLLVDYGKFYSSTQFYLTGKNIYTRIYVTKTEEKNHQPTQVVKKLGAALNPPFFTMLSLPFGLLNYPLSLTLWSALCLACGVLSIILLRKAIAVYQSPPPLLYLLLPFFVYFPTFANSQYGQVTLLLLPFICGAWYAARTNQFHLLGFLLGFVTSLKIIFGLFVIYFLLRREWRALSAFILTFIICTLLPITLFGTHVYADYQQVMQHITWYATSWNASLYGVLLRLFGGAELNVPLIHFPYLTQKLFWLLSALIIIGLLKFLWPDSKISPSVKRDYDFAIILVAMLLLSPLGWLYYFPLLVIPYVVIIQAQDQHPHAFALCVITALTIALSGIAHESVSAGEITSSNNIYIFIMSSYYTLTLLILFALLFFLRFFPVQSQPIKQPGKLTVDEFSLLIYSFALLPSLFAILGIINDSILFGEQVIFHYNAITFGT